MNKIMDYLLNRQATSKEPLTDADLLLGNHPKKVIHFVTFKELSVNVFQSIKQVQKIVSEANVRLIVNGNLKDRLLIKLLTFTIQQKKAFTVVVTDGYRALRNPKLNQSEDLAIIIETH
ncbi:hypothetical protein ACFC9N_16980 [Enterococcus casseliflavus]|uniref:hypothetical protein n=1 Tax=Enterococcus casseliflavus TaxID=37734 RepID=UPI0039A68524